MRRQRPSAAPVTTSPVDHPACALNPSQAFPPARDFLLWGGACRGPNRAKIPTDSLLPPPAISMRRAWWCPVTGTISAAS
jgi:hypothetical protein